MTLDRSACTDVRAGPCGPEGVIRDDMTTRGPGGYTRRHDGPVPCVTIPSDDPAFGEHVRRLSERFPDAGAAELEVRLRQLFPRAAVRARGLSSEPEVWYVYRDGAWRPPSGPWWDEPLVPQLVLGQDGWIREANVAARSLLGIEGADPHHYSDF